MLGSGQRLERHTLADTMDPVYLFIMLKTELSLGAPSIKCRRRQGRPLDILGTMEKNHIPYLYTTLSAATRQYRYLIFCRWRIVRLAGQTLNFSLLLSFHLLLPASALRLTSAGRQNIQHGWSYRYRRSREAHVSVCNSCEHLRLPQLLASRPRPGSTTLQRCHAPRATVPRIRKRRRRR